MKTQILIILMMLGSVATAAEVSERVPMRIDFNGMIDQNNRAKTELKKDIDTQTQGAELEKHAEKAKVIDFVDVELGWGEAPKVVDRRYDSVDEK